MMRKIIIGGLLLNTVMTASQQASARPDAFLTSKQIVITGTFVANGTTYSVHVTDRVRSAVTVSTTNLEQLDVFASPVGMYLDDHLKEVVIHDGTNQPPCKASGDDVEIVDAGTIVTVTSTDTNCLASFTGNIGSYTTPKLVGTSLVSDANVMFEDGSTILGVSATGSSGQISRTLLGAMITP